MPRDTSGGINRCENSNVVFLRAHLILREKQTFNQGLFNYFHPFKVITLN